MLNAPEEHSAILLTCIKLPPVFKTFVLSIFEWLLKTGLIVAIMLANGLCAIKVVHTSFKSRLDGAVVMRDNWRAK